MPDKLRYYLDKKNKKVYTLKKVIDGKETLSAHYKFIKIKNAPKIGFRRK